LFDVYQAMKDVRTLIGIDDLHPTPRGYENRPAAGWRAR
jgi:hypothetical protein